MAACWARAVCCAQLCICHWPASCFELGSRQLQRQPRSLHGNPRRLAQQHAYAAARTSSTTSKSIPTRSQQACATKHITSTKLGHVVAQVPPVIVDGKFVSPPPLPFPPWAPESRSSDEMLTCSRTESVNSPRASNNVTLQSNRPLPSPETYSRICREVDSKGFKETWTAGSVSRPGAQVKPRVKSANTAPVLMIDNSASPLPDKASNAGASALMMRPGATFVTNMADSARASKRMRVVCR
mmetsp:Transcript_59034/g.129412  ORF Transcript_59034/g.129412 Transcript_59034/m.129412 type:complete len:241 (-) Transcript_59034:1190-1912(-)